VKYIEEKWFLFLAIQPLKRQSFVKTTISGRKMMQCDEALAKNLKCRKK